MNREAGKFGRSFLAKWILVTSGSCALALPATFIVAGILGEGNLAVMATGLCIGAVVGHSQWFLLRKKIPISGWWGLACAVGLGLPYIIGVNLSELGLLPHLTGYRILGEAILGISGGFLSGLLQIPLLRPHFVKAYLWILASSIGWGICFLPFHLGDLLGLPVTANMGPISAAIVTGSMFFLSASMGLILLGVVTGICLVRTPYLR